MEGWKKGDIYLANLDPVVGVEQAGTRPVLVVQNDVVNPLLPTLLAAPLTSKLKAGRFLLTVPLPAKATGLPKDSVALLFRIRTLEKRRLIRKIGRLSEELIEKVDLQITLAFGLETYLAPVWLGKLER